MAVHQGIQASQPAISTPQSSSPVLRFFHTRIFQILLVLLATATGFLIAPADMMPGAYVATVNATVDGHTLAVDFPFEIDGAAAEVVTRTASLDGYQLAVEGPAAYEYKLGQQITYRLQVLDSNGRQRHLPLDAAGSHIAGSSYSQVLPPTARSGEWLTFTMRLPYRARIAMALLFAVAALWLLEPIPLAASALLIPVVVVIANIADDKTVLQPFFHPIIVLFLAGFLMAEAMRRTKLDRLIALQILKRAASKPAGLMLAMMGITSFLSMWMSNTASVAIIIPIALAIIDKIDENGQPVQKGFVQAMILGVAYAGAIGGIGSAIGTPANFLALTFLSEFAGTQLTFVDWFKYGLPMVILMVPIIWLYLLGTFRVRRMDIDLKAALNDNEVTGHLQVTRDQKIIGLVFVVVVGLWLTESWHGISASIVALLGALILFFFSMIAEEDLNHINWNALLTFGGGMAIGSILVTTGVSDWVALQLIGLGSLPAVLVIFLVAALTVAIGALISNTACAAMLIPLAIPLAQILHIDPRLLVGVVAIASSIDFALVIGTPPTMLAYSTGQFETSEIFRRGIVLDLIGVLLLSFGIVWLWQLLGAVSLY